MNKKNLTIAAVAGVLIGILTIPTINNLPLPGVFVSFSPGTIGLILGLLSIAGYLVAEILAKWISIFRQIGKFAVVGILNTVLDFAIFNLLISATGITEGTGVVVFAGIGFTVAVTNSYYWNKYWTFNFRGKVNKEFLQFFVVSIIGFGLNIGAVAVVVNIIGPIGNIAPETWANIGKLTGTLAGLVWNFLGYKFIVFKVKDNNLTK